MDYNLVSFIYLMAFKPSLFRSMSTIHLVFSYSGISLYLLIKRFAYYLIGGN